MTTPDLVGPRKSVKVEVNGPISDCSFAIHRDIAKRAADHAVANHSAALRAAVEGLARPEGPGISDLVSRRLVLALLDHPERLTPTETL